ncbi:hypothetical protein [Paenibacillus zanthoxyli]|uniref:hypothetical protein n=1 Tax=Paenibacillus zanthoxyli TaxID=369399 RepID=UPI0004B92C49|nr:hypothetical protein [Paenibacillus zanthoxyli]
MKKSFKFLASMSLSLIMLMTASSGVFAESAESVSSVHKLKLDALTVDTPYDPAFYDFVRTEKGKEVNVKVVEKATGDVVTEYGEIVGESKPGKLTTAALSTNSTASTTSTGTYTTRTAYRTFYDSGYNGTHFAQATLYTVYQTWQSGSFGQINSVSDTYWATTGSGSYTLVDPHASTVPTGSIGSYPCNQITTTGTVVFQTAQTESSGISIANFGFTMSTTGYYRYPVNNAAYNITFGI